HYTDVFTNGKTVYAVQRNAQADPAKLRQLNSFFFWTSWASATNRPNNTISYTSNFPSEPLVGNVPTSSAIVWTGVSVIMLIAGIGWMVWFYANRGDGEAVAITESDRKVFHCRHAVIPSPDRDGHDHCPLWRRRSGLLRNSARSILAVCGLTHLAHTARHFLDRDCLARGG